VKRAMRKTCAGFQLDFRKKREKLSGFVKLLSPGSDEKKGFGCRRLNVGSREGKGGGQV